MEVVKELGKEREQEEREQGGDWEFVLGQIERKGTGLVEALQIYMHPPSGAPLGLKKFGLIWVGLGIAQGQGATVSRAPEEAAFEKAQGGLCGGWGSVVVGGGHCSFFAGTLGSKLLAFPVGSSSSPHPSKGFQPQPPPLHNHLAGDNQCCCLRGESKNEGPRA